MRLCFKIKNNGKLHQNVFLDAAACVRLNTGKYISSHNSIVWRNACVQLYSHREVTTLLKNLKKAFRALQSVLFSVELCKSFPKWDP